MGQTNAVTPIAAKKFNRSRFSHKLFIESYGVKVCIATSDAAAKVRISEMLPDFLANSYSIIGETVVEHTFYYVWNTSGRDSLYRNGEKVSVKTERAKVLRQLSSLVRLTIAEFAVGHVFIHAGVVGWKGKAIVMPASTYQGKSTLVVGLVKSGALYYSDEYAVLDKEGRVRPFPKMISLRMQADDRTQTDHAVETFGGIAGTEPIPVGMILFTKYKPNGRWNPQRVSPGKGLIEIIRDTIPIRTDPQFTLSVLKKAIESAAIIKSARSDASETAPKILELLETDRV